MTEVRNEETVEKTTVSVTIDGVAFEANPGELIIEAAERAGVYIPRFCYHPRMEPVGVCRMCLVEVSGPRGLSLQPSCYLRVVEGQEILTNSEKARKAQEGVLELLLTNHPLDCPVCDKGGECPLQDQAMAHGPGETRFIEEKRHWAKPIEIGPLVALDRERCIQCSRCTRFAADVAGEALIDFAFRGAEIEVAPFPLEPFSSYFSGNTVQICPVGALTAQPYRFKSRPWDLEQAESTCEGCAVGCRTVAQSSAGALVRYLGVDVDAVNRSWLCDKGRFGHEAVHAANRLSAPLLRREGALTESTWSEAISIAAAAIADAIRDHGAESVAVIGGARLTNEDAYAFAKLAKSIIGTDSVDAQLGDGLPAELVLGLPRATINSAALAKAVLVLGTDLREELPVLYLRLRGAAMAKEATTVIDVTPVTTSLAAFATTVNYLPGDLARTVALVADLPGAEGFGLDATQLSAARRALADSGIAADGSGLVVVAGRGDLGESAEVVSSALLSLHHALPGATFLPALRRANVHGALDMGLAPGLLPGRVDLDAGGDLIANGWNAVPRARGRDAITTLRAAADGEIKVLITLGADLVADVPDRALVREALAKVSSLVTVATHDDATVRVANVVLPVAGEAERSGTVTNLEGRVAPTTQKVVPPGTAWPAWIVASEIARRLGADLGFADFAAISHEISAAAGVYRGLSLGAARVEARREGVIVPLSNTPVTIATRRLDPMATPGITSVTEQGAQMTTGRTEEAAVEALIAPVSTAALLDHFGEPSIVFAPKVDAYTHRLSVRRALYDQGTLVQSSASMAPLAAPLIAQLHPHSLAALGISDGGLVRLRSSRGSIDVTVRANTALDRRLVVIPARAELDGAVGAFDLIDAAEFAVDVQLESI
jgi:NADH-quinone oxidoreductase subunit G